MSLDPGGLATALGSIAAGADRAAAAALWGQAYAAYAAAAQDVSGDLLVSGNAAAMAQTLNSLFTQDAAWIAAHPGQTGQDVSAQDAAEAFGTALRGFWTGATFGALAVPSPVVTGTTGGNGVFSKELTSTVVATDTSGLVSTLTQLFSAPTGQTEVRINAIALALHQATTSGVTVLITGIDTTVPAPLPITNTNTVH